MAIELSSDPFYIHLSCFSYVDEGLHTIRSRLGKQKEPIRCDACGDSIRGEIMWRLEGGHWDNPFAYLCTCCAPNYVYAE